MTKETDHIRADVGMWQEGLNSCDYTDSGGREFYAANIQAELAKAVLLLVETLEEVSDDNSN